jgi:hypothetical protein
VIVATQQLRCRVCGGIAFDCKCWAVAALEVEIARCDAVLAGQRARRDVFVRQRQAAAQLLSQAKAAAVLAGASVPLWAQAQEAAPYPECPASASCVYLLLPRAFQLSAEDGFAIGVAIVGILACAYAFKAAVRALNVADRSDEE